MFPRNQLGTKVLDRERVVNMILDRVKKQREKYQPEPQSVYLCGCRAMGKTSLLKLVAEKLNKEGYHVLFFLNAEYADNVLHLLLQRISEQSNKKEEEKENIAVLIDDVSLESSATIFTALMKDTTNQNLVVIGGGVSRFKISNNTWMFQDVFSINELALTVEDKDFLKLVEELKVLNVTPTSQLAEDICKYIFASIH